jgi:hypothetical protein
MVDCSTNHACSAPLPVTAAATAAAGLVNVTLSLNGGVGGSFSADRAPFLLYEHPVISSVHPTSGIATGGTVVTIVGAGFGTLSALPSLAGSAAALVLCGFGGEAQSVPLAHVNDTQAICLTTWGQQSGGAGQPVQLALNGASFSTGGGVRFAFEGLHPGAARCSRR